MFRPQEGVGSSGQLVPGPPWILGRRGAALEAPENTLSSLRRAVELGLDGCAYELRACAEGDLVLLADPTLDRTTDAHGPLAIRTLPELFRVDAGGWFGKRFVGEPLALLEEALALEGNHHGAHPQHVLELAEPGLVHDVARIVKGVGQRLSIRVASRSRDVCVEARDAGLVPMLTARSATEEDRRFVRDERIAAYAVDAGGWSAGLAAAEWTAERWSLGVDDPDQLVAACRTPLNGFTTHEPRRALAARALCFLAPHDTGAFPLRVPELAIDPSARLPGPGEWCGRFEVTARIRNPFAFRAAIEVELNVRRGTFEAHGLPARLELEPDASAEIPFTLSGGSWSPGGDPLLVAHYHWRRGPGRPEEHLTLDAPLARVRSISLGERAQRLPMLREHPTDSEASVTVRRHGRWLMAAIENPGGLAHAALRVHLDGVVHHGGRGLRIALPADFARRSGGVRFSIGMVGREPARAHAREAARERLRRWAGGLPSSLEGGAPGRLLPLAHA